MKLSVVRHIELCHNQRLCAFVVCAGCNEDAGNQFNK